MISLPSSPFRRPYDMYAIEGMIVGGAVGDALGAPIEFMRIEEIRRQFGPTGLTDYAEAYGRIGAITDDTQMTMFTLEGILFAGHPEEILPEIRDAYKRWYQGQAGAPYWGPSTLANIEPFVSRRAPGNTCLSAMAAGGWGRTREPINSSAGCGGVMRVAPIAVLGPWGQDVFAVAAEAAAMTHGDPRGYLPAGVLATLLKGILEGMGLREALSMAHQCFYSWECSAETRRAVWEPIRLALYLASESGAPTPARVEQLGGGWVGDEALAIALYAALTARSFTDGILVAVNHSGDSDSTGSIAGQILGAMHGEFAIPDWWRKQLEAGEVIRDHAFRLWLKGREADKWG